MDADKQFYEKIKTTLKSKPKSSSQAEFCGNLFTCADSLHLTHLKSKSYAEHVALGEIYNSIRDMADDITELFQGYHGLLDIHIKESCACEPISYLKTERQKITEFAKGTTELDIQNKIQDLIAVITKGIYKLENLK